MQLKTIAPWEALSRSFSLLVQAAPREFSYFAVRNLVTGVGPSISLYLSKLVIDETTRLLSHGPLTHPVAVVSGHSLLLWSLGGMVGVNLAVDAIGTFGNALYAAMFDRVRGHIQDRVLQKVAYFNDIALFEIPELLNLLELTQKGISRIQQLGVTLVGVLAGIFTFIPSVVLAASLTWWVPLLLLTTSIPATVAEVRYRKKSWRVEEQQAGLTRELDLYARMMMGEAYAKEIRLFSLQGVLLDRWRHLFHRIFTMMQAVRQEEALTSLLWSGLSEICTMIPYVYVLLGVLQGTYTIGDIALYTGIIFQVQRSVEALFGSTGRIYDVILATVPIFQLLDLEPQLVSGYQAIAASEPSHGSSRSLPPSTPILELRQVAFVYPGSDSPTLAQINLTIQQGEMVALVGENGAGKTTLAKLICRLYDPSDGLILWQGRDVRSLDLADLRSRIAVVMQDYSRFPATLRENVGWGYLPHLSQDSAVAQAMRGAGIEALIQELEQGLETQLGKQLEQGIDLSGGQWQRVAIARALMRLSDVDLLVFDEPTAALDPNHEHEIYQLFQTIARGRTSVVVSHRLALAKMADRIVVLEQGKIVEVGSHEELMAQGDRYHQMFTRQASSYV